MDVSTLRATVGMPVAKTEPESNTYQLVLYRILRLDLVKAPMYLSELGLLRVEVRAGVFDVMMVNLRLLISVNTFTSHIHIVLNNYTLSVRVES
jgi:hypothetical protein